MPRVLIFGSRDNRDHRSVWSGLDWFRNHDSRMSINLIILCGYDPWEPRHQGVDQLAYEWAKVRDLPVMTFPAPWRLGPRAGPGRNSLMLTDGKPNYGVAFPGGKGTADMRKKLVDARVPIFDLGA